MDKEERLEYQRKIIDDVEKFGTYYCRRKCFFNNMTIFDTRNITIETGDILDCLDFPEKYCDACQIKKFIEALKNEF